MKKIHLEHQLGSQNPTVTLLEFGDFECPYCAKFDLIVQKLIKDFPQDLAYTFRHFPMVNIHHDAGLASIAAEAAGLQNKYWQIHHMLFTQQENLSGAEIMKMARKLGLNEKKFQSDLESEELWNKVQQHIGAGIIAHVNGTPSLYLNNEIYIGSSSYDCLKKEINTRIINHQHKFI